MNRILLFTGPTISQEQVQALAPHVEIYPPVAAGDLLRLSLVAGDLVAIIDGFFYQSASVRHKEILDLMRRGIHVWGASSMGALRGAELSPLGMRGFGSIFESYRSGELDGDDEVTIMHAPEDMGYTHLTEALVNIRYACKCAQEEHIISSSMQGMIIEIAKGLPFYSRIYPVILKQALEQGLAKQEADVFQDFVSRDRERFNLKKKDALELIEALQSPPQESLVTSFEWHETTFIHAWRISDQRTRIADDQWIFDGDLLTAYQLFGRDYPDFHYNLLLETLVGSAADALKIEKPSTSEARFQLVAQYISARIYLQPDQALPVSLAKWLRPEEKTLSKSEQIARLAVRLWYSPLGLDWHKAMIEHIKKSTIFDLLVQLVTEVYATNDRLWGQNTLIQTQNFPLDLISPWFKQRWNETETDFEIVLLDRGFRDEDDFLKRVRLFYIFDKYVGADKIDKHIFAPAGTDIGNLIMSDRM